MLTSALKRLGARELLLCATFLAGAGVVMVYSASAVRAELSFGTSSVYFLRQLGGLMLGLAAAALAARLPLALLRRSGLWLWALTTGLLALTLTPLGVEQNGAARWLALGPVVFQPLEPAKLGLVLGLASWLAGRQERIDDARVSILVPALMVGLPALVLLAQPDFGGALLLVAFAGILVFVAGGRLDHLGAAGVLALPLVITAALARGYRTTRLETFLDPWADPLGQGYQLVQSLIAFGSGGLFGVGLGAGQQKLGFLPEAHTDFILSVVGEEAGLLGVGAILLAFAVLGSACLAIALRARDAHAMLIATGAGLLLWLQGLMNAGVAMGVLPTTGATLPLFSYGRTSLVTSLCAVGLVLAVARPRRAGRGAWR